MRTHYLRFKWVYTPMCCLSGSTTGPVSRSTSARILRGSLEKPSEPFGTFSNPLFYRPAWRSEIRFFLKSFSAIASSSRAKSGRSISFMERGPTLICMKIARIESDGCREISVGAQVVPRVHQIIAFSQIGFGVARSIVVD